MAAFQRYRQQKHDGAKNQFESLRKSGTESQIGAKAQTMLKLQCLPPRREFIKGAQNSRLMANYKQMAGERAADFVQSGMIVGLGSGSTAAYAVEEIGKRLKTGVLSDIIGIATSEATAKLAQKWQIPSSTLQAHSEIDLTIDGADEVDPQKRLIKGGGGALLREKIVAHASRREIIVADPSKMVDRLGAHFLLPVEVVPFGWNLCARDLTRLGCPGQLRVAEDEPYVTDEGNYILDCHIPAGPDIETLAKKINLFPGVVENGFFIGYADLIIIGTEEGTQLVGSLD
jgi:ribose 5-phosphate isomerase A